MEYVANIVCETEKAYKLEPVNFEYPEALFVPKKFVDNWIIPEWFMQKFKQIDGSLQLLIPDGGVKAIEKVGEWSEDPNGNNGGAKVTNANLLSVPVAAEAEAEAIDAELEVEIGDEDAGTREIDDLEDIDSEGEPEPGRGEEEEQKDPFGPNVEAEKERILKEQGRASKDEETHEPEKEIDQDKLRELEAYVIPKEICDRIDEIGDVFEVCVDQSKEIVKRKFGKYKLTGAQKSALEQDIATFTAIQVLRRGY